MVYKVPTAAADAESIAEEAKDAETRVPLGATEGLVTGLVAMIKNGVDMAHTHADGACVQAMRAVGNMCFDCDENRALFMEDADFMPALASVLNAGSAASGSKTSPLIFTRAACVCMGVLLNIAAEGHEREKQIAEDFKPTIAAACRYIGAYCFYDSESHAQQQAFHDNGVRFLVKFLEGVSVNANDTLAEAGVVGNGLALLKSLMVGGKNNSSDALDAETANMLRGGITAILENLAQFEGSGAKYAPYAWDLVDMVTRDAAPSPYVLYDPEANQRKGEALKEKRDAQRARRAEAAKNGEPVDDGEEEEEEEEEEIHQEQDCAMRLLAAAFTVDPVLDAMDLWNDDTNSGVKNNDNRGGAVTLVPILIGLMSAPLSDEITSGAALCLGNVARNDAESARVIANFDGVLPSIMRLLANPNAKVQHGALGVLKNLSLADANKVSIMQSKVPAAFLQPSSSSSDSNVDDKAGTKSLLDVLYSLTPSFHPPIRTFVASILRSLCLRCEENATLILDYPNMLERMIENAKGSDDEGVKSESTRVIVNLVRTFKGTDKALIQRIADSEYAVGLIVHLLTTNHPLLHNEALVCLVHLLGIDQATFAPKAAAADVLTKTLTLLVRDKQRPDILVNSCSLLKALVAFDADNVRVQLPQAEEGTVRSKLEALEKIDTEGAAWDAVRSNIEEINKIIVVLIDGGDA